MRTFKQKNLDHRNRANANGLALTHGNAGQTLQAVLERPATVRQAALQHSLDQSPRVQSQVQLRQSLAMRPQLVRQAKLAQTLARIDTLQPAQTVQRQTAIDEEELTHDQSQSTAAQRLVTASEHAAPPTNVAPMRKKANGTGLPGQLQAGIETLSGLSLDDVEVKYNSSEPARVNALATTQGKQIKLGPGQEQHLAHEAWHVVQQQQGRVPPTLQMNDQPVNDDASLEKEADTMGRLATETGRRVIQKMDSDSGTSLPSSHLDPSLARLAPSGPLFSATVASAPVRSLQRKAAAAGIIQRAPVNTGETLKFFDSEIPAFVTLEGFRLHREGGQLARYRIDATGQEFYFEKLTGRYFTLAFDQIDPRSLGPEVTVESGKGSDDGPPPGAGAIKEANEAITVVDLSLHCQCPLFSLQNILQPRATEQVLRGMLIRIVFPDLLQLLSEFEGSDREPSEKKASLVRSVRVLLKLVLTSPRGSASFLQWLLDVLPQISDLLIALIAPYTPESLSDLAHEDMLQNQQGLVSSTYKQALNELGSKTEGSKIPVKDRQAILLAAFQQGYNLARYLKVYKNKYKGLTEGQLVDAAISYILEHSGKRAAEFGIGNEATKGIFVSMKQLQLPPGQAELTELLHFLTGYGLSLEEISSFLGLLIRDRKRKYRGNKQSLPEAKDYLITAHRELYRPKALIISPSSFKGRNEYEGGVIDPLLLHSVERSKVKGHTLGVNPYIARHFTPAVMKFLAAHPAMYIAIYEGQVSKALADLAVQGYTEILSLSGNPVTDFRKFLARDPKSKATIFVIVGLSGQSYQREIAAHFLYYNPPINPLRIIHLRLRGEDPSRVEFEETLRSLGVVPDIVQMGNVEQVERLLREQAGIKPIRTIAAPNLYGKLYNIHGKVMISLRVEPQLYADRAGAFLRAVQELNHGQVTVIFTGTAGALDQTLQIGDLVAPPMLHQADTLQPAAIKGVINLAADYMKVHYSGEAGMITGVNVTHGAVDTILFEDQIWFEHYRRMMTIVEQEVAHLARAAAQQAQRTRLYAFFKISDVLGLQDFNANETERPEYRSKKLQGHLVLEILKQVTESGSSILIQSIDDLAVSTIKKQRNALVLKFAKKIITISNAALDVLELVHPEFVESLVEQLNSFVARSKAESIEQLMIQLSRLFQLYNLAVEHITFADDIVASSKKPSSDSKKKESKEPEDSDDDTIS